MGYTSMRRLGRRNARNRAALTIAPPLGGAFARWRADASRVNTSSGVVWTDYLNGYELSEVAGTGAPSYSASVALLGGRGGITFDGSNDKLSSTLPASSWNFLHLGTGMSYCAVMVPLSAPLGGSLLFSTSGSAPSQAGVVAFAYGNNYPTCSWKNDAGAEVVYRQTGAATLPADTPALIIGTYVEGASPESTLSVNNANENTGASSGAPGTGDAQNTLRVGLNWASGSAAHMALAELVFYTRQLSAAERTAWRTYVRRYYGF